MILCITPNPDIEHAWSVPGIHLGGVFRVAEAVILPSGKGLNAARAIHTLGGEATCAGFLAGHTGRLIAKLLAEIGIPAHWTWVKGESRISAAILDPGRPGIDATLISEAGPLVNPADWGRLICDVLAVAGARVACLCGSMPPGSPLEMVGELIECLEANGIPVWVDTSGDALAATLLAHPSGIKVNQTEIQELTGMMVTDVQQAVQAANTLLRQGIRTVSITLGEQGAVLCRSDEAWLGRVLQTHRLSSVGSGDAFLGGLLYGCSRGMAPGDLLRIAIAAGAANTLSMGGGQFTLQEFEAQMPEVSVERII